MKKRTQLLCTLTAIISLCGCSDESTSSSETTDLDTECSSNESCDSGKCLDFGKCAKVVSEGDDCDDAHLCKTPLICKDGTCQKSSDNPPSDKTCTTKDNCGADEICKNKKCTSIDYRNEGDACSLSDEAIICRDNLICWDGFCRTQAFIDDAGKCHTNDDCAGEEKYKDCLPDGSCGLSVAQGGDCSDDKALCQDDMSCMGNTCIRFVDESERCDFNESSMCKIGLLCDDDKICRKYQENLPIGSTCNESWLICDNDNTCQDGICVKIAKENEHCDEEQHILCPSDMKCLKSVCTPIGNTCSSTADCLEKDSFCCLDDSCGAKGKCIPYDDINTHDESCRYTTKPGIFEAQIQCRWKPRDDDHPLSNKVEIPPLVGAFGNKAGLKTVIAVWSFQERCFEASFPSNVNRDNHESIIRFINPENCETLESIEFEMPCSYYNNPAAADIDNDGLLELVMIDESKHPTLFKWDETQKRHVKVWQHDVVNTGTAPMFFDINSDTLPELVVGSVVIEPTTGNRVVAGIKNFAYNMGSIGYLFNRESKMASMVIEDYVLQWNDTDKEWDEIAKLPKLRPFTAYADFGTAGATASAFDFTKLDGIPEIVSGGNGGLNLYALTPKADNPKSFDVQTLMTVAYSKPAENPNTTIYGGPITVGDFDSDGLPEIGVASSGFYGVYDPRCARYEEGKCADKNVLWERWSQDVSSGKTGSSLFDFDGDGQPEAVYADECFTRVYDGKTGKVLFSAKRSSMTSIEAPVIADIDNDGSAEILMGSDINMTCYDDTAKRIDPEKNTTSNCVDPIHEGIPCLDDEDCPTSKNCNKSLGLCICETDAECNTQYMKDEQGNLKLVQQYVCAPPIHPQVGLMTNPTNGSSRTIIKEIGTRPDGWKDGDYKVCRATRKTTDIGISDLMIFKDRLDRWVSSRNMWNQHAYNIINIEDSGKVPTINEWVNNWISKITGRFIEGTTESRPQYNNFRLNKQGEYGSGTVPDITGRFDPNSICGTTEDGRHVISGKLCNRGTKPVSQNLPATFFYYDESAPDHRGDIICTSYTNTNVKVGQCDQVGCTVSQETLDSLVGKKVIMVTNLDEHGSPSTVECNGDNNSDTITIESCKKDPIFIVN